MMNKFELIVIKFAGIFLILAGGMLAVAFNGHILACTAIAFAGVIMFQHATKRLFVLYMRNERNKVREEMRERREYRAEQKAMLAGFERMLPEILAAIQQDTKDWEADRKRQREIEEEIKKKDEKKPEDEPKKPAPTLTKR